MQNNIYLIYQDDILRRNNLQKRKANTEEQSKLREQKNSSLYSNELFRILET